MSAARTGYGIPEAVEETESSQRVVGVLLLMGLVAALAAVTVWYVLVPALDTTPPAERSCEVVVLASGSTKCVSDPSKGSRATAHAAKPRAGAKKH